MVEFWSDHFNIGAEGKWWDYCKPTDEAVYRAHAVGKFSDMLLGSARSVAMGLYLDNSSSDYDDGVNENYGRELLELHTLGIIDGVQAYTEEDVVQAAHVMAGGDSTGTRTRSSSTRTPTHPRRTSCSADSGSVRPDPAGTASRTDRDRWTSSPTIPARPSTWHGSSASVSCPTSRRPHWSTRRQPSTSPTTRRSCWSCATSSTPPSSPPAKGSSSVGPSIGVWQRSGPRMRTSARASATGGRGRSGFRIFSTAWDTCSTHGRHPTDPRTTAHWSSGLT